MIVIRFITNAITAAAALWSYTEMNNSSTTEGFADIANFLVFFFFGVLFANDISTLPVNIYYYWSLDKNVDLTDKTV